MNLGYDEKDAALPPIWRHWQPYPPAQTAASAPRRDLVERYPDPPTQVLAHSDVAPERKQDPGPRFLWRELALRYGVGAWPDEARWPSLCQTQLIPWDALQWQQQLADARLRAYPSTAPGMSRAAPSCAPSSFTFAPPWSPASRMPSARPSSPPCWSATSRNQAETPLPFRPLHTDARPHAR